jgi:hypothetical protein
MTVHAQVEGVGTLEFPDGTDPSVIQSTVQKIVANQGGGATPPADKPAVPTWRDRLVEGAKTYGRTVAAPIEAAESLITGAVAAPVAGLAGIAQGAKNLITGDPKSMSAADRVRQVQEGLTYEPRTEMGRATVESATAPFRALGEAGDVAGKGVTDVATKLGASPEVAAGAGAVTNTVLQAAPSVLLPELGGKGPLGQRIAARRQPAPPRVEPTFGAQPPAPGVQPSGTPPQLPSRAPGQVDFTPDPNAPKAPLPTPARETAEQRAESYVRDRVGVDWSGLSQGLKDTITAIAQDAASLDKLDPQAVARKARFDAAGIKGTRGQIERNLSQLTKEENLVKSEAGSDIRNIKADQDTKLHGLVDRLRTETGAKAETRGQVGKSVQDTGLRARLRESKSNYDRLYKTARETEPEATVSTDPMYEFVRGNPEVLNPAIQHLNWLQSWLKKAGIESEGEVATPATVSRGSMGEPIDTAAGTKTETQRRGVKLTELDDLRKKALSIAKGGGDNAHYAGEVIKAIDKSFEEIPSAAKAWKEARDAFKAHKTEFDEQGIIKKLATDKSRTDRRAALEDTLDTVVRGSAEDIGKIKASLLEEGRGATPETKAAGEQAWKDIQGGVLDKLKEAATGKREIGNEQGVTQFNSSFRNLFNELDKDGKIDAVFSPEQAKRLRDINKLVEDLRTTPSGRVAGSDTVPRLVSMLDKVGEIPGLGKILGPVVDTAAGLVRSAHELGAEGRAVRRAKSDPLQQAVKGAKSAVRGRRNKKAAAAAAPIVPATIGEQLQNEQRS